MLSYTAYKFIHLVGIVLIVFSLGVLSVLSRPGRGEESSWRKKAAALNGIGLLLAFVSGFGLIARLGMEGWPGWVLVKILIWGTLAALMWLSPRVKNPASLLWWGTLVLAALAAGLAIFKPF